MRDICRVAVITGEYVLVLIEQNANQAHLLHFDTIANNVHNILQCGSVDTQ